MSAGTVQKCWMVGRLGHQPDKMQPVAGKPYCRFSLASHVQVRNDFGEWEEKVEWWQIRCYAKLAEIAIAHLKKGDLVSVEGTMIRVPSKSGWDVEIVARDLQMFNRCFICNPKDNKYESVRVQMPEVRAVD